MFIPRWISERIHTLIQHYPVVILTGARQTGKTTLLKKLFPHHRYVSLDLPSIAAQAEQNPEDFFAHYSAPLLIDEVQYAPRLFRFLKVLVDRQRDAKGVSSRMARSFAVRAASGK
jgi:predicted AAA+ superfamily ATPase